MNPLSIGQYLRRPEMGAVLSLVAVIAFFVIFGGVDLGSLLGAASWINFAANLGIVALPVGLLMIAGEIDISIGAMIPAGSMTVAIISGYFGLPIFVGILGALAVGVVVGLVNGILTVRTSVPSLIITLGTLVAMQGLVLGGSVLITGSASVALEAPAFAKFLFGQLIADSEVPWDDFFGTLAEIGFDGIMTACVFAWEDKADQSSTFMRSEMQRYIDKYSKK